LPYSGAGIVTDGGVQGDNVSRSIMVIFIDIVVVVVVVGGGGGGGVGVGVDG